MWMLFDTHHPPEHHCTPSQKALPDGHTVKTAHQQLREHNKKLKVLTPPPNSQYPNPIEHPWIALEHTQSMEAPAPNSQEPKEPSPNPWQHNEDPHIIRWAVLMLCLIGVNYCKSWPHCEIASTFYFKPSNKSWSVFSYHNSVNVTLFGLIHPHQEALWYLDGI